MKIPRLSFLMVGLSVLSFGFAFAAETSVQQPESETPQNRTSAPNRSSSDEEMRFRPSRERTRENASKGPQGAAHVLGTKGKLDVTQRRVTPRPNPTPGPASRVNGGRAPAQIQIQNPSGGVSHLNQTGSGKPVGVATPGPCAMPALRGQPFASPIPTAASALPTQVPTQRGPRQSILSGTTFPTRSAGTINGTDFHHRP